MDQPVDKRECGKGAERLPLPELDYDWKGASPRGRRPSTPPPPPPRGRIDLAVPTGRVRTPIIRERPRPRATASRNGRLHRGDRYRLGTDASRDETRSSINSEITIRGASFLAFCRNGLLRSSELPIRPEMAPLRPSRSRSQRTPRNQLEYCRQGTREIFNCAAEGSWARRLTEPKRPCGTGRWRPFSLCAPPRLW